MIEITVETRLDPHFPLSPCELRPIMAAILKDIGMEGSSVGLRLVDDADIARLNVAYLGCTGPTNVLSFPFEEMEEGGEEGENRKPEGRDAKKGEEGDADEEAGPYLGEIALSVDTLARETFLYGQPPREHLVRLLAHAALHLAGFDHGPLMDEMTEAALDRLAREPEES